MTVIVARDETGRQGVAQDLVADLDNRSRRAVSEQRLRELATVDLDPVVAALVEAVGDS
jgi:hypothetical protein